MADGPSRKSHLADKKFHPLDETQEFILQDVRKKSEDQQSRIGAGSRHESDEYTFVLADDPVSLVRSALRSQAPVEKQPSLQQSKNGNVQEQDSPCQAPQATQVPVRSFDREIDEASHKSTIKDPRAPKELLENRELGTVAKHVEQEARRYTKRKRSTETIANEATKYQAELDRLINEIDKLNYDCILVTQVLWNAYRQEERGLLELNEEANRLYQLSEISDRSRRKIIHEIEKTIERMAIDEHNTIKALSAFGATKKRISRIRFSNIRKIKECK